MSDPGRPNLFERALTHSTYAYEHGVENNERLEFLGDAVLQLCVSELLYRELPGTREGRLSDLRQRLVNADTLAGLARRLGLDAALRVGRGPEADALRTRTNPLADTWEALLGAVYLELGLPAAMEVVEAMVLPLAATATAAGNAKTRLQEWAQATYDGEVPDYVDLGREGPDHAPRYTTAVHVAGVERGRGSGASKKAAQQAAAQAALDGLARRDAAR